MLDRNVYLAGRGLPYLTPFVEKHISSPFTGASGAHGDKDAGNTYKIFDVIGIVSIQALFAIVNSTLVGVGGDISIGLTGSIALWASADDAPTWVGGDIIGGAAAAGATDLADSALISLNFVDGEEAIINGVDIVETTATADITDGQIDYFCIWSPMEEGARVAGIGTLSQV